MVVSPIVMKILRVGGRFRGFRISLPQALGLYGTGLGAVWGVSTLLRPIVRKLAEQCAFRADWDGLKASLSLEAGPFGFLRYLGEGLMSLAYPDVASSLVLVAVVAVSTVLWRQVAFPSPRRRGLALLALVPSLAFVLALLNVGNRVWAISDSGFLVRMQLELSLVLALVGIVRRCRRVVGVVLATLVVAAPAVAGRWLFADLAPAACYDSAWRVAFGYRASDLGFRLRTQLARERAVADGDFARALAERDDGAPPLRLSSAYRILALFRTDRIADELFLEPVAGRHDTSLAEVCQMDGWLLYYQYGLLLPARRWLFELSAECGERPLYLRTLGDISFVLGEREAARRYWTEYARFPFRGREAAARLAALRDGKSAADVPALRDIAALDALWREHVRSFSHDFVDIDRQPEAVVYDLFRSVRTATPRIARMTLAASLLGNDTDVLANNLDLLSRLAKGPALPRTWQEALVRHLGRLPADRRDAWAATVPDGLLDASVVSRWNAYAAATQGVRGPEDVRRLAEDFGDTFWYYADFVK